jgi:hypothetical protein
MKTNRIFILAMAFLTLGSFAFAQLDPFMPPNPITMGQGGAFTANPQGFNSFFYNPAGFARKGEFTLLSANAYTFADKGIVDLVLQTLNGDGPLAAAMSPRSGENDLFAQFGFSSALIEQFEAIGAWATDDSTDLAQVLTNLQSAGYITQSQIDSAGEDFSALAVAILPLISDPVEFEKALLAATGTSDAALLEAAIGGGFSITTFKTELAEANKNNAFPSGNLRAGVNLGIAYAGNGFGIGVFASADANFTGANLLTSRGRVLNTVTLAAGLAFPVGPVTLGVQVRPTFLGYTDVNPQAFLLSAVSGGSPDLSKLTGDVYTGFRIGLDVGALMDLGPFTFGAVLKDIIPFNFAQPSRYSLEEYGDAWTSGFPLGTGAELSQAELEALYQVPPLKLNVGASWRPDLGLFSRIIDPRISVDVHDVFGFFRGSDEGNTLRAEDHSIFNHLNVGADVKFLRFISVRAGYAGTFNRALTAGIGLNLLFLDINAAFAATELQRVNGDYQFKNIGFSLETAIRF